MSSATSSQGRTRGVAVLVASILLIIGAVVYIAFARSNSTGSDFKGAGNGVEQIVEIPEGSTLSAMGPALTDKGVVRSDKAFQNAAMANSDADNIQPGFYRLQEKMSADEAVKALLDPANKVDMLKIPGGSTLMDVKVVGGDTRFGIFSNISSVSCGSEGEKDSCRWSFRARPRSAGSIRPARISCVRRARIRDGGGRAGDRSLPRRR